MPQALVFEKMWYKAETNGSKIIKFGPNHPKMGTMCLIFVNAKRKLTQAKRAKCKRKV